mgnify:CR=1 FL=1
MNDIESNINELFRLLRNRPAMLITGNLNSLASYIVYFEGFIISFKLFNNLNIEREISRWYQNQVEIKSPNMYWFAQFKMDYNKLNEEEKINLLLNLLSDFFNENISLFSQKKE